MYEKATSGKVPLSRNRFKRKVKAKSKKANSHPYQPKEEGQQ
jgi:hypothetical protein